MPGCWTIVKQRGKSGQSTGSVMRACRIGQALENEELKKLEEALPMLKECDLEKASRFYKAETGVGWDGFHPKVPLDMANQIRGDIVELLGKGGTKWKMAAASMHDEVLSDSEECRK